MRLFGRIATNGSVALACAALGSCQVNTASQPEPAAPLAPAVMVAPEPVLATAVDVVAEVELRNPSEFPRLSEALYIAYYDLGLAASDARARILAARSGVGFLPSQAVDRDGNGEKDGLLVLADFAPAEVKNVSIVADAQASATTYPRLTQAEISHKVGGSWAPRKDNPQLKEYVGGTFTNVQSLTAPPEHTDHSNFIRYEGPGIESDKVAYRIYLDRRNGFDIFGKKVVVPVLQGIGQDGFESYHHMSDWGMDILKVGDSLGAGGFGYLKGRKIQLASDVKSRSVVITESGSLFSSLRISYGGWKVDNKTVDLNASFSMSAGSRLVHAELVTSEQIDNFVIGIVKHPGTELIQGNMNITDDAYTYIGSWGKQALSEDGLGMAVLFKKRSFRANVDDPANYAVVANPAGNEFDYHFVAAWQGEPGGIQTKEEFVSYLNREAERLTMPPRQRLKTTLSANAKALPLTAESAVGWAKMLADSELARKTLSYAQGGWDEHRDQKPVFGYDVVGLQPLAYDELAKEVPDPRYAAVMETVSGSYISDKGVIADYNEYEYNIDSINAGRNLLRLYERTKNEKYKKAAAVLRRQLKNHPKTSEGAFWHKKKYPHQLWLDGVYMGLPFLTHYSTLFEQGKSYDEVVNEFVLSRKYLKDPTTGLYFHAWDEKKQQDWADKNTGLSKHFWGRGMGWFAMALVDVLELLPATDEKHRRPLLEIVQEIAPALVKVQDPETGTWWQILDKPGATGNYRESTASAMFAYFFAKATRFGYLHPTYGAVAQRSFEGVVREFVNVHPDGKISMTNQCYVGGLGFGRDGSYGYYMSEPVSQNDPKGNGPFILAGVELSRLLKR